MTLLWPHELEFERTDLTGLEETALKVLKLTTLAGASYLVPGAIRASLLQRYSRGWFEVCNGAMPYIDGKVQFTRLVRACDYSAPASLLVVPGQPLTRSLIAEAEALDKTMGERLCKPVHGVRGRGLHLAHTPRDALMFARSQGELYLVQSFHPPTHGEFRYILHRTPADLEAGRGPSMRIGVRKIGPIVVGDGIHTIRELIAFERHWSIKDRRKLLLAAPATILPAGEQMKLINSGNISRRLHGFEVPEPDVLARLDVFMLGFLDALETVTGRFATICFDFGVTKNGPVLYEMQVRFATPYGQSHGVFPQHRRARKHFMYSMYISGSMV